MAVTKVQKKTAARPRKVAVKKTKYKKGLVEAMDRVEALVRKHNIDLSYLMQLKLL